MLTTFELKLAQRHVKMTPVSRVNIEQARITYDTVLMSIKDFNKSKLNEAS